MHLVNQIMAFVQDLAGAKYRAIVLHDVLHAVAQPGGRRAAGGVAIAIEPPKRLVGRIGRQVGLLAVRRQFLGATQRRGAPEHHQIDQ